MEKQLLQFLNDSEAPVNSQQWAADNGVEHAALEGSIRSLVAHQLILAQVGFRTSGVEKRMVRTRIIHRGSRLKPCKYLAGCDPHPVGIDPGGPIVCGPRFP